MEKDYKQLKTEHVSGHTGSSLFDINSVSLAMPVPYMAQQNALCCTDYIPADTPALVCPSIAYAPILAVYAWRLLRRFPA